MELTTNDLFPRLVDLVSRERFSRVDRSVQALFKKTLKRMSDGLPFIITGYMPAMWLRDSTWQVKPLLRSQHPKVIDLLVELSLSQVKLFLKDRENCYLKLVSHLGLSDEMEMRRYFDSEVTPERAHFGRWKSDFKDPKIFQDKFNSIINSKS